MVRERCGHTTERKHHVHTTPPTVLHVGVISPTYALTCLTVIRSTGGGGWWAVWGRFREGWRKGTRGLTLVSLSSSSVSSLFWAARPSWSSLTIRMMWFQLNSLIRSNHTWAWWEYGGTVRRKDRWMLCAEDPAIKVRVQGTYQWFMTPVSNSEG